MSPLDAPDTTSPLLDVRDLEVRFPLRRRMFSRGQASFAAVDGVSITVEHGTTLGVVGESGSGKTTLGRAILRLVEATRGDVLFEGRSVRGASRSELRRLRRHMQIVFQDPYGSLNPRLTIGSSIAEPLIVHRVVPRNGIRAAVAALLDRVGLAPSVADRYPHEFSGGQRQRIGIARAIALDPKLIVLDEPTSALDVSIQGQILNLLWGLKERIGLTYLFISHNLPVSRIFSDRIAVMYLGRIVEYADADELFKHPAHPYTQALLASVLSTNPDAISPSPLILGEPASAQDPPSGCRFHPRCPYAKERCKTETPQLRAPLRIHAHAIEDHATRPQHSLPEPRGFNPRDAENTGYSHRHLVACHYAEEIDTARIGTPAQLTAHFPSV